MAFWNKKKTKKLEPTCKNCEKPVWNPYWDKDRNDLCLACQNTAEGLARVRRREACSQIIKSLGPVDAESVEPVVLSFLARGNMTERELRYESLVALKVIKEIRGYCR